MIPLFPLTKKLELSDQKDVDGLIKEFPPYSDFNFISLFSYDTDNMVEVSKLFGNLVLKFQDYLDLEMFYTFFGTNDVSETIHALLKQSEKEHLRPYLKLVPHIAIEHIHAPDSFFIQEDRDNFDYVIDARAFAHLEGRTYHSKRKEQSKFLTKYEGKFSFVELDLESLIVQKEILNLFEYWISRFDKNPEESGHEYRATSKLLTAAKGFQLHGYGTYIDGKMVAYMIAEPTFQQYAVLQFGKWDMSYRGLGEYFERECILNLWNKGCAYINLEQDLGIEGLRHAKELCKPIFYLKKYRISLHQ